MAKNVEELTEELMTYNPKSEVELQSYGESSQRIYSYGVELGEYNGSLLISGSEPIESLEIILTVEELIGQLSHHQETKPVMMSAYAESSQSESFFTISTYFDGEIVTLVNGNEVY